MYHGRFKKSHYEAGFKWGRMLYEHDKQLSIHYNHILTDERKKFANACLPIYEKYYPEILDEIKGLAQGQKDDYENLYTFLFSMYCFEYNNHCTCMAIKDHEHLLLGRNSDFLVSMEALSMNCIYKLDKGYSFNANTTAFIQMEDGINEYGLAVGLTFIYPTIVKAGLNAGMLVRYILEKCKTTQEAILSLKKLAIASQQTITLADAHGDIAVVECNCEHIKVTRPKEEVAYVAIANAFISKEMKKYNNVNIDNWQSEERYLVANNTLQKQKEHYSFALIKDILSGVYGFMCQYDRKKNADTVWSVIYDIKNKEVYRVEGNPSRRKFIKNTRMKFKISQSNV